MCESEWWRLTHTRACYPQLELDSLVCVKAGAVGKKGSQTDPSGQWLHEAVRRGDLDLKEDDDGADGMAFGGAPSSKKKGRRRRK